MAEVKEESTHVPSHKVRTALFLSAMRHFAEELRAKGRRVEYRKLNARNNDGSFDPELRKAITRFKPEAVVVVEPGEYRVEQMLKQVAAALDVRLEIRPDRHFLLQPFRICRLGEGARATCGWSSSIGTCGRSRAS